MTMESPQPTKDCPECGTEMIHISTDDLGNPDVKYWVLVSVGYAEPLVALGWHCEPCGLRWPDAEPPLLYNGENHNCGMCGREDVEAYWYKEAAMCRSCAIERGGQFST